MIRCSYERFAETGAYVIGKPKALIDEHYLIPSVRKWSGNVHLAW